MGVRRHILRFCPVLAATAGVLASLSAVAAASDLVDRNATGVRLAVNDRGQALLTYRAHGRLRHVLAWGAVGAREPSRARPQVSFRLDYSGGWGTYHKQVWKTFKNRCAAYDGPRLAWFVTACRAPDGSYWAVQSWQRMLPNLGFAPWKPEQKIWELRLSHWTGPVAQLEIWLDWIYSGRFHHLFGRLTYNGLPVHGFRTTSTGSPLDGYGRNVYLDTFNSAYGPSWLRENSFVAHNPTGVFCYGFYDFKPYAGYPARRSLQGHGERYRATVIGPGVTPDVMWQGVGLHDFDRSNPSDVAYERQMNSLQDEVAAGDGLCKRH